MLQNQMKDFSAKFSQVRLKCYVRKLKKTTEIVFIWQSVSLKLRTNFTCVAASIAKCFLGNLACVN